MYFTEWIKHTNRAIWLPNRQTKVNNKYVRRENQ